MIRPNLPARSSAAQRLPGSSSADFREYVDYLVQALSSGGGAQAGCEGAADLAICSISAESARIYPGQIISIRTLPPCVSTNVAESARSVLPGAPGRARHTRTVPTRWLAGARPRPPASARSRCVHFPLLPVSEKLVDRILLKTLLYVRIQADSPFYPSRALSLQCTPSSPRSLCPEAFLVPDFRMKAGFQGHSKRNPH